jgi:hypothetical protein
MNKFAVVWHNDNPSTYIEICNSWSEVLTFMATMNEASGEYVNYIIRQKDFKVAKVLDGKIKDFQ